MGKENNELPDISGWTLLIAVLFAIAVAIGAFLLMVGEDSPLSPLYSTRKM